MKLRNQKILRWLGTILIVVGIGLIIYPLATNAYNSYRQARLKEAWEKKQAEIRKKFLEEEKKRKQKEKEKAERERQKKKQEEEYYAQLGEGDTFGKLTIPKIGVEAVVVQGTSPAALRHGPGHMTKTGLPGRVGNCYLAGHRTTWGAPFRKISELQAGDIIYFSTPYNQYTYSVAEVKTVKPTDWSVTHSTPDATLTLQSCNPVGSAAQRLIVVAKLKK